MSIDVLVCPQRTRRQQKAETATLVFSTVDLQRAAELFQDMVNNAQPKAMSFHPVVGQFLGLLKQNPQLFFRHAVAVVGDPDPGRLPGR